MRLCRFRHQSVVHLGFYGEEGVIPFVVAAAAFADATHEKLTLPFAANLFDLLPPDGKGFAAAQRVSRWLDEQPGALARAM